MLGFLALVAFSNGKPDSIFPENAPHRAVRNAMTAAITAS
jgi:hypothetical protein